jgi:hypothetical protein
MISGNPTEWSPTRQCAICARNTPGSEKKSPRSTEPSHKGASSEEERGIRPFSRFGTEARHSQGERATAREASLGDKIDNLS